MSTVRMQQNEAIYQTYKHGDISIEKHDNMLLNEVNTDQPAFCEANNLYEEIKKEETVNRENSEHANVSMLQASTYKSKTYSEYASAEKGYREAYEKGDMKTAKECQEKMDKSRAEVKENGIRNEEQKYTYESRSRH